MPVTFVFFNGRALVVEDGTTRLATPVELELRQALAQIRDGLRPWAQDCRAVELGADEVFAIAHDAIGDA